MVSGEAGALSASQASLAAFLRGSGQDEVVIGRAELLLEEVTLNALTHGGAWAVSVQAKALPGACELVFEYSGAAFDPLTAASPPVAPTLKAAPIGGLGLVLLQRLASGARYERLPLERNRLSVTLAG